MKKTFITALLSLTITIFICGAAFAENTTFHAQGRTVAPGIFTYFKNSYSYAYTYISISNITSTPVQCKVTIYDHEGNDQTSRGHVYSGEYVNGGWTGVAVSDGIFEIPAYGTRLFTMDDRTQKYSIFGHATIEWKSEDNKMSKALVASMRHYGHAGSAGTTKSGGITINNGQPF
ncbi:hypothetical protein [Desulfovibrio sp. JC022]|uniref:hypothetical protein n=1 Tax=Desulfovibrio sp. JC022 TaxID=2593642 RepID=UPI0013D1D7BC|nr:hypothetical protein [Desulfovibrio sp. JC022]NDV23667.1 hypothetical protein [Desulfovibrio sp. JC022]